MGQVYNFNAFTTINNDFIHISFQYGFNTPSEQEILDFFNQILSTFKFVEADVGSFQSGSYQNSKFGFKLNFPNDLNLTAKKYDIQAYQKEYIRKCDSGELEGCGGARWPDYQIRFYNEKNQYYFSVDIHVVPVARNLGGKEYQGFTFSVLRIHYTKPEEAPKYYITESTVKEIQDSLSFFTSTQPLSCLWLPDFIAIDTNRQSINQSSYEYAAGYYLNQNTNKCQFTEFYYGSGSNMPFESLEKCQQICLTN